MCSYYAGDSRFLFEPDRSISIRPEKVRVDQITRYTMRFEISFNDPKISLAEGFIFTIYGQEKTGMRWTVIFSGLPVISTRADFLKGLNRLIGNILEISAIGLYFTSTSI
jgi:hypothetical protein